MRSVLFTVFGVNVYAYGVAIASAFVIAVLHIQKLAAKEGIKPQVIQDAAIAAMVASLVGARTFHVITEWDHYRDNLREIPAIWEGGLTFYGGLIACLVVLPFVFRAHKIAFWDVADHFAPALALGHGIVRLGCFLNGCCYGRPAAWGLVFPEIGDGIHRQPSQLYEAGVGVVLFFILVKLHGGRKFRGQTFLSYLLLYAASRFVIEFTRDDPRGALGWLSTSQWVAIGVAVVGAGSWPWLARTRPLPPPAAGKPAGAIGV